MTFFDRRSFFGKVAIGLAALGAAGAPADAQLVYKPADWNVADFDGLVKHRARVKQVFDEIQIGGGRFLNNIKNSMNGLQFSFSIPAEQIKVVAALHGPANALNFDDFIWNKYKVGEWLKVDDPKTGQPAVRNPFLVRKSSPETQSGAQDPSDENSSYQDTSIQSLQARKVQFLCCHTATEEHARALIKLYGLTQQPEEIVKEMLAHTVPGVIVVAAMVSCIALLQSEGHYSYVTV
jgi:intracellular sulfur oxidation DsrE/DsrF family protein